MSRSYNPDLIPKFTFSPDFEDHLPVGLSLDALEKIFILKTLTTCKGNRSHACHVLGIGHRTLQRKLGIWRKATGGK